MASPTTATPALTDAEIARLLDTLKGADSVELKLTVPEPHQRSAATALELDPLDAQIRQVFFFDTPDLALDGTGVVVRARRIQGKGGDSIVKLRPVVPSELPADLRRSKAFRVEVDALPGGFVCSGTLKGTPDPADVLQAAKGALPLRKLFSKEQRQLFSAHAPEGVGLDDLVVLGPIFVLKLRFEPPAARPQARGGDVALPGRLAHPRAVHAVRDGRGVPGRRRDSAPSSSSAASISPASRRRRHGRRSSTSRGS